MTNRIQADRCQRCIVKIILFSAGYIFLAAHTLDIIFIRTVYLPLYFKIFVALLILIIPGLLLGMLFPLGLKITSRISPDYVPCMWGINGVASVLGSVLVMITTLLLGFKMTFIIGVIFYLLALLVMTSQFFLMQDVNFIQKNTI